MADYDFMHEYRTKRKKPFRRRFKEFFRKFIAFMFSNVGIIGLVVILI